MQPHEFRRLNAGWASAPDRFCISFDEEDIDDPFSIILSYDGRFPQPWSRTEVPRLIRSITGFGSDETGDPLYAAMSDEGDVYMVRVGGTTHEKIPGAGIYSPDAADRGAVFQILVHQGQLCVVGDRDQVYLQEGDDTWRFLGRKGIAGPDTLGFLSRGGVSAGSGGLLCFGMAVHPTVDGSPEIETAIDEALARQDYDEYARLEDEIAALTPPDEAQTHLWQDGTWARLPMPRDVALRNGFAERADKLWLVGLEGAIFTGNPLDGFEDVSFAGDRDDLYAITRFQNEMIIASGYALHRFDGHILSPMKPPLDPAINGGVPNPMALQTVGDTMFYFDYKHGVCRWDGTTWDWVDIPPELLEREFSGLPSKE
ncbi:hypothetical protein [uncultured Roseobacter sp.]|uniref:hypothetical protein n=1 Tax=uncultured Roseobacter sp. TaxID=114847 RepID=UPI002603B857|nr:hypothetical protein [uncultured Roseobacter sp.]